MSDVATLAAPPVDRPTVEVRRLVLFWLAAYFAVHVLLRVMLSNSLVLDEAEQVLHSQMFQWGYGPQPPLYSWLQTGVFRVFGIHLLALSAVKNLLLFTGFWLMFLATRRMSGSDLAGLAAALSIMFMPEIAWEAQRDLTHSVLLLVTTLLSLWVFARLVESPTPAWYLLLGATTGVGILTKYNYLLLLIPLLIAAVTLRPLRPVVINRRMLLALIACAAIVGGHVAWVIANRSEAVGEKSDFVKRNATAFSGLIELVIDTLRYVGPLVVIYSLYNFRAIIGRTPIERRWPWEQLLLRTLVIGLGLLAIAIPAAGVNTIHARWLQPLLIVVPIWLAMRVQDTLTPPLIRRVTFAAMVVGVCVIVGLTIRTVMPSESKNARRPINAPFDQLAAQLRAGGFSGGTIIAADKQIGGNLHMAFPDSRTIPPKLMKLPPLDSGDVLLVWNLDEDIGFYNAVWRYADARWGPRASWPPPQTAEAKLKYAKTSTMRLGYILLHRNGHPATRP